jgi:hypothetical protein
MYLRVWLVLLMVLLLAACGGGGDDDGPLPTRVTFPEATIESTPEATPEMTPEATPEQTPEATEEANAEASDQSLAFWQADFGRPGEPSAWRFQGVARDDVTVRVLGGEARATIQTLDGQPLAQGSIASVVLPADGLYRVVVTSDGQYEIGLRYNDRPNPLAERGTDVPVVVGVPTPTPIYSGLGTFIATISAGETLAGTLTDPATPHVYTVAGQAGQYINLELAYTSGQLDPQLTLYDATGQAMALDDDSGPDRAARIRNVRLPADGLYSVQAGTGRGGYTLTVDLADTPFPVETIQVVGSGATVTPAPDFTVPTPAPADFGQTLIDHRPVNDRIEDPADLRLYSFESTAGDVVTVGANPINGSGVRLQLEISDPDGNLIGRATSDEADAAGDVLLTPLRTELTGVYQVFVTPLGGTTGDYSISYGRGTSRLEIAIGAPAEESIQQGVIRRRATRDVWSLTLRAGDALTLDVIPIDDRFDPLVQVVAIEDPATVIFVDDNSGPEAAALLRGVTVPRDGVYLVRVLAAQPGNTGPYTLRWQAGSNLPTATPLPQIAPILTVDDQIEPGTYRFYPFYAQADERIYISVTGQTLGFDPVLAVIDPAGEEIAGADDSGGTLNPRLEFTVPATGTYQVRVNGYDNGGRYVVQVGQVQPR